MVDNSRAFQIIANILMFLFMIFCLFPFVLLVVSSFTDEGTLIRNGYSLFPEKFSLESYAYMYERLDTIVRAYGITVFVTVVGTVTSLIITVLLAYPLSRRDLPHRGKFAFFVFFTMLFNGGLVPTYIMWTRYLNIDNTIWALIIPALLLNAFYVIMMRTYFTTTIPDEVIEAGRIDGAGEFRILFRIVLPMSLPMVATLSLLIGLNYWNDWRNGLYYLTDHSLFSVQNMLNTMLQDVRFLASGGAGGNASEIASNMPSVGIKMAIAVVGALPIMMVYPFFQRYFVKGITVGAVKG
ncbi:carbohydrate ABC transporter permease [Paenibacillus sp. FSL W8-0187]|uniref:Sugar ABC transporter permease n=1 Tax=Paenibacillus lautus TaxID=1401 RepID=A0A1R1ALH5_PAELA|nr:MULTISPECIES: carbohydrate ABC transporter permease [Paenibacillus]OME86429.1 sugar ABC transporter permease [Paenibacillus lautus]GIO98414.1 sugar ABC transporter permease [Paenibacillus lautus]